MRKLLAVVLAALVSCGQERKEGVAVFAPGAVRWEPAPGMPAGAMTCLQRGDPVKGRHQVLLKFPAGVSVAPHYHKFDETATVVSGTVIIGQGETADETKGVEVGAGGYFVIPAATPHWAKMKSDATLVRYGDGPREMTPVKAGETLPKTAGITVVKPEEIKWTDAPDLAKGAGRLLQCGDPAKGPHLVRLKFPEGTFRPAHWHSADETVTVLSGTLAVGQGEKADASKEIAVEAGGYCIIPARTGHWVRAKTDVVFHIFINGARDITYYEP